MKMKNRTHRHDTNRPRYRHGHKYSRYKKCLWWYFHVLSNTYVTFEAQFIKNLKKALFVKKTRIVS